MIIVKFIANTISKLFSKRFFSYSVILLIMLVTILCLSTYFAVNEYRTNFQTLKEKLSAETERIERGFTDIIQHTEFVMRVIIMQIKLNPNDLDHVYNIISKYSVNPRVNNVLSWSPFSWLDNNNVKKMDSFKGLVKKLPNLPISESHYIKNARLEPGKMHLGAPIFGTISQRHVIPAAIGVTNEDEYIGSLSVGFDLVNLSNTLSNSVRDPHIYFALLDHKMEIILQSQNNLVAGTNAIDPAKVKNLVKKHNLKFDSLSTFAEINMITKGAIHYFHKINGYPFIIYIYHDNKAVIEDFWEDIVYRLIEICIIAFVAFVIIVAIQKREKELRAKAENAKQTAIEAYKAKTDFLAYTAHELRSPLGFIISGSEVMSNKLLGPISEKYLEYSKAIYQSGRELLEFIDDLLDNMKVEHFNFKINETVVDVKKIILRAVKVNDVNYNHKINIETNFAENLPNLISDQKRLLQIFNNVISNSIKYSSENTLLNINVNMYKGQMVIDFQDHGYGMTDAELEAAMGKYTSHCKDINTKSVGLGLSLVKSLLDLMGARFLINSKVGEGTKILIIFPKEKVKWNTSDKK